MMSTRFVRASTLVLLIAACSSKSSPPKTNASGDTISNTAPLDAAAAGSAASDPAAGSASTLRVTGIDPARGDVDGGTFVLIRGERFMADGPRHVKVYFGSRQGTVVRFQSDTELIVQAPGGKANEQVDVLLIFEPGGELELPSAFTFVEKP